MMAWIGDKNCFEYYNTGIIAFEKKKILWYNMHNYNYTQKKIQKQK